MWNQFTLKRTYLRITIMKQKKKKKKNRRKNVKTLKYYAFKKIFNLIIACDECVTTKHQRPSSQKYE